MHHGKPEYTYEVRIVPAPERDGVIEYTADFYVIDAAGMQVKYVKGSRVYAYYEAAWDEACCEASDLIASMHGTEPTQDADPQSAT